MRRSAVAVLVNLSANEQNKAPIANVRPPARTVPVVLRGVGTGSAAPRRGWRMQSTALTALLTLAYAKDVQSQARLPAALTSALPLSSLGLSQRCGLHATRPTPRADALWMRLAV